MKEQRVQSFTYIHTYTRRLLHQKKKSVLFFCLNLLECKQQQQDKDDNTVENFKFKVQHLRNTNTVNLNSFVQRHHRRIPTCPAKDVLFLAVWCKNIL